MILPICTYMHMLCFHIYKPYQAHGKTLLKNAESCTPIAKTLWRYLAKPFHNTSLLLGQYGESCVSNSVCQRLKLQHSAYCNLVCSFTFLYLLLFGEKNRKALHV